MTIDNFIPAQKTDVSVQKESNEKFQPIGSFDSTSADFNADYHQARGTRTQSADGKVTNHLSDLKIDNSSTDVTPHSIYSADEFRQRSQSIFSKIDRNGDGLLTNLELTYAGSSKNFDQKNQQVIEALKRNQDRFEILSDDEFGDDSGIAMEDLDQLAGLDDRTKRYEQDSPIENWFGHSNNFVHVDADGDGYLSKGEIETRLTEKSVNTQELIALERMRRSYDELMAQSNDEWGTENSGISRQDINTLVTLRQRTRHEIDAATNALAVAHRVHSRQHKHENTAG